MTTSDVTGRDGRARHGVVTCATLPKSPSRRQRVSEIRTKQWLQRHLPRNELPGRPRLHPRRGLLARSLLARNEARLRMTRSSSRVTRITKTKTLVMSLGRSWIATLSTRTTWTTWTRIMGVRTRERRSVNAPRRPRRRRRARGLRNGRRNEGATRPTRTRTRTRMRAG